MLTTEKCLNFLKKPPRVASRFLMKKNDKVWIKYLGLVLNSALSWIC